MARLAWHATSLNSPTKGSRHHRFKFNRLVPCALAFPHSSASASARSGRARRRVDLVAARRRHGRAWRAESSARGSSSFYRLASSSARSTTIYSIADGLVRARPHRPARPAARSDLSSLRRREKASRSTCSTAAFSHTHPELAGRVRRGYDAVSRTIQDLQRARHRRRRRDRRRDARRRARRGDRRREDGAVRQAARHHQGHRRRRALGDRGSQAASGTGRRQLVVHRRHRRATFRRSTAPSTQLRAAGIPVIVSAGNLEIDACHVSPGNSPRATIVVGASARRDERQSTAATTIDRSPRAGHGVRPVHRPLRAGRLGAAAEPRPRPRADLAAVERNVDVGGLRERRGRALSRDASRRDARTEVLQRI